MQKIYIAALLILLASISLLVLLTRGQPVLVRKKIMLSLLIMSLTAPSATVVSCKSGSSLQDEIWERDGWIDSNTFRIYATGIPKSGAVSVIHKKGSAHESAVLRAQLMIMEKFKGAMVESCGGMVDYDKDFLRVEKAFMPIIKKGKVVAERYDEEFNCNIVYEITSKDLKKKVQTYTID